MADEINAGGNEQPSEGDLQTAESPAPAADSPDSRSNEPDWKREYLEKGKPAQEEANRLRRENEELRRAQSPAAPTDVDPNKPKTVWDWANGGDTVAAATIAVAQQQALRDNLDDIDDATIRKAVRAKYATGKYQLGEFEQVVAEEKARKEMTDENARLREQLKRHAKPQTTPDAPSTSARETPDRESKTTMTAKQWADEQARLPMFDALKKQALKNQGKIVIED